MNIGIVNSHMLGTIFDPNERVDWNRPDYFSQRVFEELAGTSLEEYAESHPHMIIFSLDEPTEDIWDADPRAN